MTARQKERQQLKAIMKRIEKEGAIRRVELHSEFLTDHLNGMAWYIKCMKQTTSYKRIIWAQKQLEERKVHLQWIRNELELAQRKAY